MEPTEVNANRFALLPGERDVTKRGIMSAPAPLLATGSLSATRPASTSRTTRLIIATISIASCAGTSTFSWVSTLRSRATIPSARYARPSTHVRPLIAGGIGDNDARILAGQSLANQRAVVCLGETTLLAHEIPQRECSVEDTLPVVGASEQLGARRPHERV